MANKYRVILLILFVLQDTVFSNCNGKDCIHKGDCSTEEIKIKIPTMMGHLANNINIYKVQNKIIGLMQLIQITTSAQLESSSDTIDQIRTIVYSSIVLNRTQNIGNCFDDKEEQLNALNSNIITERNERITVYHNFGLNWLYHANITLGNIRENITGLSVILSKCLSNSTGVRDCLWNLFQTIQDWSTTLPKTIASISNSAEQIADEVKGNITNCVSACLVSSIIEFGNLILEISQCVYWNNNTCNSAGNSQKSCLAQFDDLYIPDLSKLSTIFRNLSNAIDVMNILIASIDDTKIQQLTNGKSLITKLISDKTSVIKSILNGNNFGPAIRKCIENVTNKTDNMIKSFTDTLKQCQISITQPNENLIRSQIYAFTDNKQKICNIPKQFASCMFDIHCIVTVYNNIFGMLNIDTIISKTIYEVTELVMSVKRNLESCTTKSVNSTTQFTASLIPLVTSCIGNITSIKDIINIGSITNI